MYIDFLALILAFIVLVLFIIVFRIVQSKRRFKKELELEASLWYPIDSTGVEKKRLIGHVVFSLQNLSSEFKGLYISKVSIQHEDFVARPFNNLYLTRAKQGSNLFSVSFYVPKTTVDLLAGKAVSIKLSGYLFTHDQKTKTVRGQLSARDQQL